MTVLIKYDALRGPWNSMTHAGRRGSQPLNSETSYFYTGFFAGGFKPFHFGHWVSIQSISGWCDLVHLFVSINDRKRPGEIEVRGKDMFEIWKDILEPKMPGNVVVHYSMEPMRELLNTINDIGINKKTECKKRNINFFYYIYMENYVTEKIFGHNFSKVKSATGTRYLADNQMLFCEEPGRLYSGTFMRDLIRNGNFASFEQLMPNVLSEDEKRFIYEKLRANVK